MKRFLTILLIVLGLIAVLVFFMPLRLAVSLSGLEDSRFSAREISGTIWNGRIEAARIGVFDLGDLNAGVQFLPLLTGQVKIDLERPAADGDGGLSATLGKRGPNLLLENATTRLQLGSELAPMPASDIDLDAVSVTFANGRCQSATGQVRLSLDANIPGLDLKRGLLGNAKCEDGVLILPLVSASGMEELTMKLEGNGFYTARLLLRGNESAWTLILPTLGFLKTPDGYAIKIAGQLGK